MVFGRQEGWDIYIVLAEQAKRKYREINFIRINIGVVGDIRVVEFLSRISVKFSHLDKQYVLNWVNNKLSLKNCP